VTDRKSVRHPGGPGAPHAGGRPRVPSAIVVGGGIAGLAAATGLAERGVAVTVLEREAQLGGRVGSWTETGPDGAALSMGRGFHAFFRQYYNLRSLLRRADPGLDRLVPLPDYPLIDAAGRVDRFRGLPRTPPWNALAFALRSPTFRLRDLARINPLAAAPLAAVSVPEIYDRLDEVDAASFLRAVRFPPAAQHLAFEVFSRSFFADPAELSAAELATMFHLYFLGSDEGLVFDVPDADFDTALWSPLRAHLERLGVRFRTGVTVTAVEPGWTVHTGAESWTADAVVLATDPAALGRIVTASPLPDPAWRERVASLRTAPPFLVRRLWLDRPVAAERPAFLATGGLDPLDNISVLNRYEAEATAWAGRTGGSVVELHAYAAPADAAARSLARLHQLYPETASAGIVHDLELWRADCPLAGLGDFGRRPFVGTPFAGLALAGDGIRVDLPVALMERAASTGWQAANHLLAGWGLAGHDLRTVPVRGRSATVHRLVHRVTANRRPIR
jgi:isorenieratene synthase